MSCDCDEIRKLNTKIEEIEKKSKNTGCSCKIDKELKKNNDIMFEVLNMIANENNKFSDYKKLKIIKQFVKDTLEKLNKKI